MLGIVLPGLSLVSSVYFFKKINNRPSGKSTHQVFIYSNFTDKATKANRR